MRVSLYLAAAVAVLALAVWAYRENYATQRTRAEIAQLQEHIAAMRERLEVLQAEWAYLNRPDRLRALAEINYDSLQLVPMTPGQFGTIGEVAFPPVEDQAPPDSGAAGGPQ